MSVRGDIDQAGRVGRDMGRVADLYDLIHDSQALRQRLEADLSRLKTIEKTLAAIADSLFAEWTSRR